MRALGLPMMLAAGVMAFSLGGHAAGGAPSTTDWPCPQRKVAKLGASDLQWQGAPVDGVKGWREDRDIAKLVETLSNRRIAIEQAIGSLKTYAAALPTTERTGKLTLVFAGLLDTVNNYRASVITGIERFNRRQKLRSAEIEQEGQKLAELQRAADKDPAAKIEYQKALELYDWNTRVFEERRQNLPLACEIPPAIDGRIFEVVREIQGLMGQPG